MYYRQINRKLIDFPPSSVLHATQLSGFPFTIHVNTRESLRLEEPVPVARSVCIGTGTLFEFECASTGLIVVDFLRRVHEALYDRYVGSVF